MALEIAEPVRGEALPRRVGTRTVDHGPNLFLDKGWLAQSAADGETYDVPCDGEWVKDTIRKGPHKGEEVDRLTGDAAEITRQLREAAQSLGIGVSIKYYPLKVKGREIKGKLLLKYVATKRKQRRVATTETAPVAQSE